MAAALQTTARPPAPPTERAASDFAPLLADLKATGLMDRRHGYYFRVIAVNLLLFAATWAAVLWLGNTWWQLLLAVPVALFSARATFVGHDAGHRQIGAGHRTHRAMSLLHGNLMNGMSVGWWINKHNKHHANPNHRDKDLDVAVGVLVWTPTRPADAGACPVG